MKIQDWEKEVPLVIREDVVWKMEAYRLGLFLSDACWEDSLLIIDRKRFSLADQPYRSVGSISANIIEGYSRRLQKEKARFYEISLGSALLERQEIDILNPDIFLVLKKYSQESTF